jgi:hypothetical protein
MWNVFGIDVSKCYPRFHLDHVQCENLTKQDVCTVLTVWNGVIIILHLQAPEEPKKSTEQEEKLKKLKDVIAR